jgi:hypothetical protein
MKKETEPIHNPYEGAIGVSVQVDGNRIVETYTTGDVVVRGFVDGVYALNAHSIFRRFSTKF